MARMARVAATIAICLAACACAVGPRYQVPSPPPLAAGPFVSTSAALSPDAPLPDGWWRLYRDPVLDRLVVEALGENTDLKVAAANLANARALAGEARSGLYPTTDLTAQASYGRSATAGTLAQLAGRPAKSGWTYSPAFTAAYEVDLFGRVRRTIEAARADADAQRAAEDLLRTTIAAETALAYVNTCAYQRQALVARHSLAVVRETYDITLQERQAGSVSDLDVARAATLLRQAEAAVPLYEGERRVALFELTALLGKAPAQAPAEAAACQVAPVLATPLPVGDGAALLRRRPDIRQAERQLAAATARIGVATAALYPDITLNGSISSAASSLSRLGAPLTTAYGVGPLISWSLPNTTLAQAQIRAAKATAAGALATFDGTILQALKEAEQALSTEAAELDRHTALAAARDQADEALRLAGVQAKAGALSQFDLLQTEAMAVAADQALAASDQQLAADQVGVFKALGGGWETASP